jgi:hypothetical protein
MHMSNQKIRNDHYKFEAMRHRENRTMRHNLDPHLTNRSIRGFMNSTVTSATGLLNGAKGLFAPAGGRGGSGSGGGGGGESGASGGSGSYGGGGVGGVNGGGGVGGVNESGSAINSNIPSASTHIKDNDGMQSSSLIPIAIGVAVVGFFIFSKKK